MGKIKFEIVVNILSNEKTDDISKTVIKQIEPEMYDIFMYFGRDYIVARRYNMVTLRNQLKFVNTVTAAKTLVYNKVEERYKLNEYYSVKELSTFIRDLVKVTAFSRLSLTKIFYEAKISETTFSGRKSRYEKSVQLLKRREELNFDILRNL